MEIINHPYWDYIAVAYFFLLWVGYSYFSKFMAKRTHCLASILDVHRVWWMERMLLRENRIADAALLANLERNVNFFASTTMIIIAAILTALTSSANWIVLDVGIDSGLNKYKMLLLLAIMIYAFFTFTWSLRQFGFGSVLLGAAPIPDQKEFNATQRKEYAYSTGKVLDHAGHSFNYGLRAYYFSMAVLAWFVHPVLFVVSTSVVLAVLYRREFYSKSLKHMVMDEAILKSNDE